MFAAQKGVVGLKNVGNTCFLNAVLQSLASVRSFHLYVEESSKGQLSSLKEMPLTQAFKSTLAVLSSKSAPVEPPITTVGPLKSKFLTSEQQDAHEFMQYVITLLSEESESMALPPSLFSALSKESAPQPHFIFRKASALSYNPSEVSIASINAKKNPFAGILKSTLECTVCKRRSIPSYQKFIDLSLSIPPGFKTPSLEDCLGMFTQTEDVSDVDCSSCARYLHAKKKLTIARAPKTLCLHIRRLISMGGPCVKLDTHIQFPLELDIGPYCSFTEPSGERSVSPKKVVPATKANGKTISKLEQIMKQSTSTPSVPTSSIVGGTRDYEHRNDWNIVPLRNQTIQKGKTSPSNSGSSIKYELVSVIVHHGNHAGGHYTVYRKLLAPPLSSKSFESIASAMSPKWYHISDEHSRPVSEDEVLRSQAYMLYYEKSEIL